jgi:hypothetical protein
MDALSSIDPESPIGKAIAFANTGEVDQLFRLWEEYKDKDPGLAAQIRTHNEAALLNSFDRRARQQKEAQSSF